MTRTMTRPFIVEIASSGPTSQNRRNDPNKCSAAYCGDRCIRAANPEQLACSSLVAGFRRPASDRAGWVSAAASRHKRERGFLAKCVSTRVSRPASDRTGVGRGFDTQRVTGTSCEVGVHQGRVAHVDPDSWRLASFEGKLWRPTSGQAIHCGDRFTCQADLVQCRAETVLCRVGTVLC